MRKLGQYCLRCAVSVTLVLSLANCSKKETHLRAADENAVLAASAFFAGEPSSATRSLRLAVPVDTGSSDGGVIQKPGGATGGNDGGNIIPPGGTGSTSSGTGTGTIGGTTGSGSSTTGANSGSGAGTVSTGTGSGNPTGSGTTVGGNSGSGG